jgi:hypothetical protein
MYWVRIHFSASLTNTTEIKYIGHKFNTDDELYSLYPDLNNTHLKTAFASGKTTWDEQSFLAGQEIIRYLKANHVVRHKSQIMDYDLFNHAGIHKTAELIYSALGKDYAQDKSMARLGFQESIDLDQFHIDTNRDGNLEETEQFRNSGILYR